MKPQKLRPIYFIWIVAPLFFVGTYLMFGLPHIHWNYTYKVHSGNASGRWKTSCSYIGSYGEFYTNSNSDGTCDFFIFRKKQGGRNSG